MSRVILKEYCELWQKEFENEASKIRDALGDNLSEIHHIGSTSIPGMIAKPILDIMPVVKSLHQVDQLRKLLEEQGYLYRGEYGIPNRRYVVGLMPGSKEHRVNIHIFESGDIEIRRHIIFRDYLRENKASAEQYRNLKIELKKRYEFDKSNYQAGKAKFCESILALAIGKECPAPVRTKI